MFLFVPRVFLSRSRQHPFLLCSVWVFGLDLDTNLFLCSVWLLVQAQTKTFFRFCSAWLRLDLDKNIRFLLRLAFVQIQTECLFFLFRLCSCLDLCKKLFLFVPFGIFAQTQTNLFRFVPLWFLYRPIQQPFSCLLRLGSLFRSEQKPSSLCSAFGFCLDLDKKLFLFAPFGFRLRYRQKTFSLWTRLTFVKIQTKTIVLVCFVWFLFRCKQNLSWLLRLVFVQIQTKKPFSFLPSLGIRCVQAHTKTCFLLFRLVFVYVQTKPFSFCSV